MLPVMIRRAAAFLALLTLGAIDAQAQTRSYPSLAKRPVEATDRLAERTPAPVQPAATDAALVQTVTSLQAKATTADAAFRTKLAKGRPLVAAASGAAPVSESWVQAQMAISAADAARYESIASLASLDTLQVSHMDNEDGARVAADVATIEPVRTRVLALVDAQNDALDALRKTLSNP
ncbi:MAG: hypothetical protein J7498_12245 [Sphingobium sp.]|nr:hypothetical protein [Sphingobium sp.]